MDMTVTLVRIFLFTLPFQFALSPIPGVDLHLSRIFAITIFLFWLVSGLLRKKIILPFSKTTFFLLSFIFLSAASFLWADQGLIALRRAAFPLSYLPLFFVFYSIFEEKKMDGVVTLLNSLFFGAALAALVGLLQVIASAFFGVEAVFSIWTASVLPFFLGTSFASVVAEYPSMLVNISGTTLFRASAFFPDPHMFAYFMGMLFPIGIFLALRTKKNPEKRVLFLLSGVIVFADLLSFSRGAYLGLVLGGIFVAGEFFRRMDPKKRWYIIPIAVILSAAVFFPGSPIGNRLISSFSFEEGSNQGRIAMWREAGEKISEQPLLGYGLGNYSFSVKPGAALREPIYAHNLLLDVATETGVAGALLFLFALLSAMYGLARKSVFLAAPLVVFFGHSLVETPLYSVHIFPMLLFFLALSESMDDI